jgi:hypothetical protein
LFKVWLGGDFESIGRDVSEGTAFESRLIAWEVIQKLRAARRDQYGCKRRQILSGGFGQGRANNTVEPLSIHGLPTYFLQLNPNKNPRLNTLLGMRVLQFQ